jgi:hypothetical protein
LSAALGIGVLGCRLSLSPLQNRIAVGSEPFFVFVADGEDGLGDLFVARSEGGPVYPVTFTRLHETMPVLAPDGTALAFLRTRQPADSADYRVVVLNLMNGAERTLFSASEGASIRHIGWNHEGTALYVETDAAVYEVTSPPAPLRQAVLGLSALTRADSAFRVYVGSPNFAEVRSCRTGGAEAGLCAIPRGGGGDESPLVAGGRDPVRWGPDSVGYYTDDGLEVRPVGRGNARRVRLRASPVHPRLPTYFPGRQTR